MTVELCNNSSEANVINKNITTVATVSNAVIKGDISHENPILILTFNGSVANQINYMRISEFKRSYFITEVINLTGGRYEIRGKSDVLESFKSNILGLSVIVDKQEGVGLSNKYYNDGSFISSEKEFIYTKQFPNGFNDNGEFILITAGGIAT